VGNTQSHTHNDECMYILQPITTIPETVVLHNPDLLCLVPQGAGQAARYVQVTHRDRLNRHTKKKPGVPKENTFPRV
jgi:hypothetical protein